MSSSGGARPFPPTASPASTACCANAPRRQALGPDVDIEIEAYDECNTVIDVKRAIRDIRAAAAASSALVGVQSNQYPARARSRAPVPRGGHPGRHRRLPCQRLHLDAAGAAAGTAGGARARRHACMPARAKAAWPTSCATSTRGSAKPIYNYLKDMPDMDGGDLADPAAQGRHPRRRALCQLRCRPRLPVPMQLLHHHQRAGPQVALPHRRRRRRHRARQCQAGHHALLHHRRQLRPQQELGADPRPADPAAREGRLQDPAAAAGRHALPPDSRISSRRPRAPAAPRSSSGWRTSIRNR